MLVKQRTDRCFNFILGEQDNIVHKSVTQLQRIPGPLSLDPPSNNACRAQP
jgi:hypothetical protein